jgi:uncharacterized low-complexity protein
MSKKTITPVVTIAGLALAGGMAISTANAADNPFAAHEMSSGYMQLAAAEGEGDTKCGGEEKSEKEGKSGGEKSEKEGKCGGSH